MRGRKPKPTRLKVVEGNAGKRRINGREPTPPSSKPTCPSHLSPTAKAEWKRLAETLNRIGILTQVDRTVLAAYCQAYGRWVEAEKKLAETPVLLKTPAGYVQQSPWLYDLEQTNGADGEVHGRAGSDAIVAEPPGDQHPRRAEALGVGQRG